MERSPKSELTRRINRALALLNQGLAPSKVIQALIAEFGVSYTQAHRYLQKARKSQGPLPIPETKIVFTVKLTPSLIERSRIFARRHGIFMSDLVSQALEGFLNQQEHGRQKSGQKD